jgi:hypothetical protein
MSYGIVVDHSRGLCHEPDGPMNGVPRKVFEANPSHCKCCGHVLRTADMSESLDRLGMYRVVCPVCPGSDVL